jgi:F-type H+-transporting ATPase subunit b
MNQLFILAGLLEPAVGLIFWTSITFLLLLVLLGKFAWKPILNAIKTREESIKVALESAEKAKLDMLELKSTNETILNQARAERDMMLKEARETKDAIVSEAKQKAQADADRIISSAREQIISEKNSAVADLKKQVATLSIEIAEKILKTELSNIDKQKELVSALTKNLKLN